MSRLCLAGILMQPRSLKSCMMNVTVIFNMPLAKLKQQILFSHELDNSYLVFGTTRLLYYIF